MKRNPNPAPMEEASEDEEEEDPTLPMGKRALKACLLAFLPTPEAAETLSMKAALAHVRAAFPLEEAALVRVCVCMRACLHDSGIRMSCGWSSRGTKERKSIRT